MQKRQKFDFFFSKMFIIIFHHVTTWHVMLGCYLKISFFFLKNSQNVLVWCKTCRKDTILKRNSKICSFVKCSFNVRWPSTMKKCVCVYLCHQSVMSHSRELRLLLMNGGTTVWAWRQYLVLCSRFFRTSFLEQQDISNNSCRLDTRTISHLTRINVSVCVCICVRVCVYLFSTVVFEKDLVEQIFVDLVNQMLWRSHMNRHPLVCDVDPQDWRTDPGCRQKLFSSLMIDWLMDLFNHILYFFHQQINQLPIH